MMPLGKCAGGEVILYGTSNPPLVVHLHAIPELTESHPIIWKANLLVHVIADLIS